MTMNVGETMTIEEHGFLWWVGMVVFGGLFWWALAFVFIMRWLRG